MENEKLILNTTNPQEVADSLLQGVSGGDSEEDWDVKMPFKYKLNELVRVPVLNDGVWRIYIRRHFTTFTPPSNFYDVEQNGDFNTVSEMMIFPIL